LNTRRREGVGVRPAIDAARGGDERDVDVARGQVPHQIVHGAFEAALAVQRRDGASDDRDAKPCGHARQAARG
jgi:hypothetical protein